MKAEARTARSRLYPVAVLYTAYAIVVIALGLRAEARTAALFIAGGVVFWTLLEYLVHRYVLHGVFPDGRGLVRHTLHRVFDRSHGDHHLRPWDGRHINGSFDTLPFAVALVAASWFARLPTGPVFMAAILQCYVIEEWVHYAVHFHRFRSRYFEYIRRHHLYHHGARGRDVAFGLTSGVWDVPLGTRIPARDRETLYARGAVDRVAGAAPASGAEPIIGWPRGETAELVPERVDAAQPPTNLAASAGRSR